ncbi:MAG: branched-chain amino acid ABC transporter permease [Nitrososphaerota archaeon]
MLDLISYQLTMGLFRASYYWLIASGLTLIFGVTRVINFSHAALFVLGGYAAISVFGVTGNFWVAVAASSLIVGLVGVTIEVLLLRRLYRVDPLYQLLMTFAATLIINDATKLIWGPASRSLTLPTELATPVRIGALSVPAVIPLVISVALGVAILLYFALEKTFWGLKVQATWRDIFMAEALRINSRSIFTTTFLLGSVLAGFGGATMVSFTPVAPGLGDHLIITAFIIVVIAGLGNLVGAYIASLIVGVAESLFIAFFPEVDILLIFAIMVAVLLVRPWGIFGER